ncbi:MAG: hypothetical protein BWY67_02278 [Bacteroidetes bacterium ADurb.Bin397]|nr:MAG: hypothetical protein BWY67_02278 [Bacteroidetes bacterium ADurb.Bin397]
MLSSADFTGISTKAEPLVSLRIPSTAVTPSQAAVTVKLSALAAIVAGSTMIPAGGVTVIAD